jgi:hypothetical protein
MYPSALLQNNGVNHAEAIADLVNGASGARPAG